MDAVLTPSVPTSHLPPAAEVLTGRFDITGEVPLDAGYWLFAGLCERLPEIHGNREILVGPLRGEVRHGDAPTLKLGPSYGSCLEIRGVPLERLATLQNSWLRVGSTVVGLGGFYPLLAEPVPCLRAQRVILGYPEVEDFTAHLHHTLERAIGPRFNPDTGLGWKATVGKRRVLVLPKREVSVGRAAPLLQERKKIGYQVSLENLTPKQSTYLLRNGLGRSTRFGCGFLF